MLLRSSALCLLAASALPFCAQNAVLKAPRPAHEARVARDPVSNSGQALPLRRVALYKNGVGFFEHIGTISGSPHVTITFTTAQLNDVLQTLTAIDLGGGHITGAGYNSTTPVDQQLKNLPVTLSEDPTAADFYKAIRGSRVEVTGSGAPITGRILNVEVRTVGSITKDDGTTTGGTEKHFLTVISDSGTVRSVEVTSNTNVHILDPVLQDGMKRYLQVLNSTRADGLRHLTLTDTGSGTREMRVSYISEVPVWKSTYRILFDEKPKASTGTDTATLQGWAVIDNTVGTDWDNVQLSLIAGAPQSFIQPISQPYYSRRSEIGLPQEAQLTPQTHESGTTETASAGMPPTPSPALSMQSVTRSKNSFGGALGGPIGSGSGSGAGVGPGISGNYGGGVYQVASHDLVLETETSQKQQILNYTDSAAASIAPNTSTNKFDDYFEYKLTDPITIRRNESALVPILQTKVPAERVTLWSQSHPTPLRALWITNGSSLTLDRGSFSIVESGNFGGQGLLDPIHPGEKRLLSYAADQAIRVGQESLHDSRKLQQIAISKGVLTEKTVEVAERSYRIWNAASDDRNVVIEHERRRGWELDSDPAPTETTDALYRFRVHIDPHSDVRLHVGERHTISSTYRVASINDSQLQFIYRSLGNISLQSEQALRNALAPVTEARRKLADIDKQINDRNSEITRISNDQRRVRENLSALKSSAEERDLVRRYTKELNEQEDRLATLRKELDGLNQQRSAAEADLNHIVESLQFAV